MMNPKRVVEVTAGLALIAASVYLLLHEHDAASRHPEWFHLTLVVAGLFFVSKKTTRELADMALKVASGVLPWKRGGG